MPATGFFIAGRWEGYCREAYSLSHAFGVADLGGKKSKGEICGFSL